MESLESLNQRIDYGKKVNNDASKMFFSLEPTLRFTLINYLIKNSEREITEEHFYYISDLELISMFGEINEPEGAINEQIYEVYQAIVDFRLITYSQKHGINTEVIKTKSNNLKNTDYYLNVMEDVVDKLLSRKSI